MLPAEEFSLYDKEGYRGLSLFAQGVIDLLLVCDDDRLLLVDYKTDRVTAAQELKGLYSGQLGIYRRCLEQVIGLPVKQTLIYSFRLGETIEI